MSQAWREGCSRDDQAHGTVITRPQSLAEGVAWRQAGAACAVVGHLCTAAGPHQTEAWAAAGKPAVHTASLQAAVCTVPWLAGVCTALLQAAAAAAAAGVPAEAVPAAARSVVAEVLQQQLGQVPQPLHCASGSPAGSSAAHSLPPAGPAWMRHVRYDIRSTQSQCLLISECIKHSNPSIHIGMVTGAPSEPLLRTCRCRSMVAAGSSRPTSSSSSSGLMAVAAAVGVGGSACTAAASVAAAAAPAALRDRRGGRGGRGAALFSTEPSSAGAWRPPLPRLAPSAVRLPEAERLADRCLLTERCRLGRGSPGAADSCSSVGVLSSHAEGFEIELQGVRGIESLKSDTHSR